MAWLFVAESTLVMAVPVMLSFSSDLSKGFELVPEKKVSRERTDPGISELSFNFKLVSGVVFKLRSGKLGFGRVSAGVREGLGEAGTLDFAGRYLRSNGFPVDWPQRTEV